MYLLSIFFRAAMALLLLMALPAASMAQQTERLYAGGTFTAYTQTHSDDPPLGGTTWTGSFFVGGRVSPRLAVEFEPTFGRTFSWTYDYLPGPTIPAHVVASRRDTFWAGQLRVRAGVMEPVLGLAYTQANVERHATVSGRSYFDDQRTAHGVAAVLGIDAPVPIGPHVALLPTFRLLLKFDPGSDSDTLSDRLGAETKTGMAVLRYGVGARIAF